MDQVPMNDLVKLKTAPANYLNFERDSSGQGFVYLNILGTPWGIITIA